MMRQTIGNRLAWITGMMHWDIRKAFTLPQYHSEDIDDMLVKVESSLINSHVGLDSAFEISYETSARQMMEDRFSSYPIFMPASTYRRTSLDFHMKRDQNSRIGAFVKAETPSIVWMTDGMLSAIEDASQVLLALWENPIGLQFTKMQTFQFPYSLGRVTPSEMFSKIDDDSVMPLRLAYRQFEDSFVDYGVGGSGEYDLPTYSLDGKVFRMPKIIVDRFLLVSQDPSRQIFADHLSQASLSWIIAHEDAHKYSGHIQLLRNLGISVQDQIFNELVAPFEDLKNIERRRAAELEADTCATMRTIDICFDSEFLEFLTDWMSFEMREEIYKGKKRYSELDARQRLILMRFLTVSILLPLTILDIGTSSTPSSNLQCYPPFIVRALNVIFTVASRAMDVSLDQPQYWVGRFDLTEFPLFFHLALQDMLNVYQLVQGVMDKRYSYSIRQFPNNLKAIESSMVQAFFLCHDQPHVVNIRDTLQRSNFTEDNQVVADFLMERQKMYLHRSESFLSAKKQVNQSRLDKVGEDLVLALKSMNIAKKFYGFL